MATIEETHSAETKPNNQIHWWQIPSLWTVSTILIRMTVVCLENVYFFFFSPFALCPSPMHLHRNTLENIGRVCSAQFSLWLNVEKPNDADSILDCRWSKIFCKQMPFIDPFIVFRIHKLGSGHGLTNITHMHRHTRHTEFIVNIPKHQQSRFSLNWFMRLQFTHIFGWCRTISPSLTTCKWRRNVCVFLCGENRCACSFIPQCPQHPMHKHTTGEMLSFHLSGAQFPKRKKKQQFLGIGRRTVLWMWTICIQFNFMNGRDRQSSA